MKDEISRPKKHQQYSDELLYFTQSVIKMESEISHITQDQTTKNSGIRDPHFLPEVMSDTHEQLSELQRNVNFSSTKLKHEAPEANKKIIGAGFSDLKTDGRVSTSNLSENEMKTKGSEEITMPRKQVSDSPLWSPSDVTHTDNRGEIENGLCNISLSRVYFAQQAGGITDNRVILDGIQRTMNGPVLDRCNIRSNERKGARQWNKMTILNRKQSVLSSSANAFAKSSRIKGMFQNPAASGSKKQTGKRSFSDVEEYVYFLPENKETESTFNCGSSSKSESACKHFPNKKHCKDERKKGEKTVVEDSVRHAEVVSRIQGKFVGKRKASLPSMKVVADSQGRIIVNVADAVEEKRNSFENSSNVPEIIVVEDDEEPQINTQDLGVNKRNFTGYRNYSPKRERAHLCTKHYFNLKTRQCSHNSALISNHSCWDSWRRANCVSDEENDTFENQKKHYHQMVTPINAFKEVKGTTNPMDLNNNSHALRFEPPHLNECIQTNRHPVPDKDIFRHAAVTMQDSRYSNRTDASYSENNQHSERFFGKPSTSVIKNHSRNCHVEEAISKDEEKICIYTDRQFVYSSYPREQDISYMNKTKSLMAEVSSGRTTCMYNIESTTKESQIQIQNNNTNPKSCGESDVREENAAILARRQHGDNRIKISSENADEGGYEDSETSSNMSPRDVPTMVGTTGPKVQYKVNAKVAGELPKEVYKRGEEVKTNLTKNSITELDGRYQCDWPACQKTFRHYSFLVLHKRIHTGERPYVCSWKGCNKQFRRSDDYQRHYRVHTGSKPYECVVCGKAFKRSDHRLFHYRAIHNMTDVKRGKKK